MLTANEFQGLDFSLSLEGVVRNAGLQGDALLLALNQDPARIGPDLVCLTVLCFMLSSWACLAMVLRASKGGTWGACCLGRCCWAEDEAGGKAPGGGRLANGAGSADGMAALSAVVSTDVDGMYEQQPGKPGVCGATTTVVPENEGGAPAAAAKLG